SVGGVLLEILHEQCRRPIKDRPLLFAFHGYPQADPSADLPPYQPQESARARLQGRRLDHPLRHGGSELSWGNLRSLPLGPTRVGPWMRRQGMRISTAERLLAQGAALYRGEAVSRRAKIAVLGGVC